MTGRSPAELLFGRQLRTRLDLLRPSLDDTVRDRQQTQVEAAGGAVRQFRVGDAVWARNYSGSSRWRSGRVVSQTGPVSYEVDVGEVIWSRHVDQLVARADRGDRQPNSSRDVPGFGREPPDQRYIREPTDPPLGPLQPAGRRGQEVPAATGMEPLQPPRWGGEGRRCRLQQRRVFISRPSGGVRRPRKAALTQSSGTVMIQCSRTQIPW